MQDMMDDVPKYRKKRSGKSRASSKASHKHEYMDCLLTTDDGHVHKAQYCKVCGKLHHVQFFLTHKQADGTYLMLNNEEVLREYPDLPRFAVHDSWQKYIALNK